MQRLAVLVLVTLLWSWPCSAGVNFTVSVDPAVAGGKPLAGRLIVSLIRKGSSVPPDVSPNDAPFWDDPQPMYGMNVTGLTPTSPVTLDDHADAFEAALGKLAPGEYAAAARLIVNRESSNWRQDAGNLFSPTVTFTVAEGAPVAVALRLNAATKAREWPGDPRESGGAQLVEVRSKILSEFHGRDVMLRAGVVFPLAFDPTKPYAAVYIVPGFGGTHFDAIDEARRRSRLARPGAVKADAPERLLAAFTFAVVLDPESPNGHTLFADSANNGPWARALVEELIPAIEAKYPLARTPQGRLLRGHSSGGWSTLWLALTHPETFGATWSSSPDPVDFRRLQLVDIEGQKNMFTVKSAAAAAPERSFPDAPRFDRADATVGTPAAPGYEVAIASFRRDGRALMTIRQENAGERVLGPDQTSGQQWASWQAVWGPRVGERGWGKGHPAALYDAVTGVIDPKVAEEFRAFDIGRMVRSDPAKYLPLLRERARIIVGDQDNFFLNEAVSLLKADLERLNADGKARSGPGYITIVPGCDHSTIFESAAMRAVDGEIMEHVKHANLIPN